MMDLYDVVVVGAGPAGAMAATVLGRQRRDVLVVDSGMPRNKPATAMHMYLSRDGFSPAKLLEIAREEITAYPTVTLTSGVVESITGSQGDFTVSYSHNGKTRTAKAKVIVLATGQVDEIADMTGLKERWGRGVFHCVYCYGFECTGRKIGVLSSRPGDAMLARYIADRFSDDVVLFNRGYEMTDQIRAILDSANITIVDDDIVEISGKAPDLRLKGAEGTEYEREIIFYRPDSRHHSPLAAQLGCEQSQQWGTIFVNAMQQTSVPGVYAAGDIAVNRDLPAATGFVTSGASDGQRAAVWIEQELFLRTISEQL